MRGWRRQATTAVFGAAIVVVSFVYRFTTLGGPLGGFDNDHFTALVRSVAMLGGELPLRDFADAELRGLWPPLSYLTSAVAQQAFGQSLRSEALLCIGLLSLGAGVLYAIAASITGRPAIAGWSALMAVGMGPTLYNYPKIVPHALAVAAMAWYTRRPGGVRLAALALSIVVATLFRHDHGVVLSLAAAALLWFVHGRAAVRPVVTVALLVVAGLLPGLVFAQRHGGVVAYVRDGIALTRQEAERTTAAPEGLHLDWSQPWIAEIPPPAAPPRRISVRWRDGLADDERAAAEAALGLREPESRGEGRGWSYVLADAGAGPLRTLVEDPRVADTDGIDRRNFVLAPVPAPDVDARPWWRWRVAPGLLTAANGAPWLYAVGWVVLIAAALTLSVPSLRQRTAAGTAPLLGAVCLLGFLMYLTLLRNPAAFRLADASVPIVVLGSWLLGSLAAALHPLPVARRAAARVAVAGVLVLTTLAVGAVGDVVAQVNAMGVADGATGVPERWRTVWTVLGGLPASTVGLEEELAGTVDYVRRCTAPSDRLLVDDYFPEVFYFADRRFAAGLPIFFSNFYRTDAQQRAALARWQSQEVPLVLMEGGEDFDDGFASEYPLLAAHLRARYRRAGTLDVRRGSRLDVWAVTGRPAHPDAETGLPCFVD